VHAVFVTVRIADSARYEEAMGRLRETVVPQVKGAPGFVRGTWLGDNANGHAVVVFETEEQAQQMADMVPNLAVDPVQVQDVKVYPVTAQA
jgi:hypothetical protein